MTVELMAATGWSLEEVYRHTGDVMFRDKDPCRILTGKISQDARARDVLRVGKLEAYGGGGGRKQEDAVADRRCELYIEFCMPPPPWICWPEQFSLGLEWKLAVLQGCEPAMCAAHELRRLRCALEWDALSGWAEARPHVMRYGRLHDQSTGRDVPYRLAPWERQWEIDTGRWERPRRPLMEFDAPAGWTRTDRHGTVRECMCLSELLVICPHPSRDGPWENGVLRCRSEAAVAQIRLKESELAQLAEVQKELIV